MNVSADVTGWDWAVMLDGTARSTESQDEIENLTTGEPLATVSDSTKRRSVGSSRWRELLSRSGRSSRHAHERPRYVSWQS